MTSFLFAIVIASDAIAANSSFNDACGNELDQIGLNACAYKKYLRSDKILNLRFAAISRCVAHPAINSSSEGGRRLVAAQRDWIKFRDSECAFQVGSNPEGGTMFPMNLAVCKTELTDAKIKKLDYYINCSSSNNDPTCPTRGCNLGKSGEAAPKP